LASEAGAAERFGDGGARGRGGKGARGNRMRETEQSCAREEIACQHLPPRVHLTGGDSEREREIERERERAAGRRYLESSPAALYSDLAVAASPIRGSSPFVTEPPS